MTVKEYKKVFGPDHLVCACGHVYLLHTTEGCRACYPCHKFKAMVIQPEEPPQTPNSY